jgi:hypothetical protein
VLVEKRFDLIDGSHGGECEAAVVVRGLRGCEVAARVAEEGDVGREVEGGCYVSARRGSRE